jgi:hypothetical protein
MNTRSRAPAYDLMKLIVAILLLFLFLFLLWRGTASSPVPTLTPLPPPGETSSPTSAMDTDTPPAEPGATATLLISPTATPPPPDPSPTATATFAGIPTQTPDSGPTITATAGAPSVPTACDLATSRSRLQIGRQATILRRLNFRSSPGIANNWLLTNNPGTRVEVVDGPVCLPYFVGAYVWWQIQLPDGSIGWSAESSLRGGFYFMEPIQ